MPVRSMLVASTSHNLAILIRIVLSPLYFIGGLLLLSAPASAKYYLAPGDEIEVSVLEVPELQRTEAVDGNGQLNLPLIGQFSVAGQTIDQVRAIIRSRLTARVVRRRNPRGEHTPIVIEPNEVFVKLAKYRPVYVSGVVAKPGLYQYNVTMSVRDAIALAGGHGLASLCRDNVGNGLFDLIGKFRSDRISYFNLLAKRWRLRSELGERAKPKERIIEQVETGDSTERSEIVRIFDLADGLRKENDERFAKHLIHLRELVVRIDSQIKTYRRQVEEEQQALALDTRELKQLTDLHKRGNLNNSRMASVRRAVVLSSTRVLQTKGRLLDAQRQKAELEQKLEALPYERRVQLRNELEPTTAQLYMVQAQMQGLKLKAQNLTSSSDLQHSGSVDNLVVSVHRKRGKKHDKLSVDLSFELMPGDHIEVGWKFKMARPRLAR